MLEVSVIVQNGDQNGRTGFDVFLVSNSLTRYTGLVHTFLGNVDSAEEAEEAASLWKAAFHSFQDDNRKEISQLKGAGFTFCTVHNSVSRGNRCDESEGEIKSHEDNLIQKEKEEEEKIPQIKGAPSITNFSFGGLPLKEKEKLEKKFKIKPLEIRECELLPLFYMVPTKIKGE